MHPIRPLYIVGICHWNNNERNLARSRNNCTIRRVLFIDPTVACVVAENASLKFEELQGTREFLHIFHYYLEHESAPAKDIQM